MGRKKEVRCKECELKILIVNMNLENILDGQKLDR